MIDLTSIALQTIGSTNQGISDVGAGFREFIGTITDIQMFIYKGMDALIHGFQFLSGG